MLKHAGKMLPIALALASFTRGWCEEPAGTSDKGTAPVAADVASPTLRPTLEEARRQAEILHNAMHATLQVVHHQYYREDQGLPLPAGIMKDVFAELKSEQQIELRWLAVEGQAMNTDHKPQNDFEQAAVKALKAGEREYAAITDGIYRRAGPITLTNHCLKCHVPDRKSTEDRTAGLIIAIPIGE